MLLPPLHGTLDLHDGLATLIVAGTLGMASLLSTVLARRREASGREVPQPATVPPGDERVAP